MMRRNPTHDRNAADRVSDIELGVAVVLIGLLVVLSTVIVPLIG